jgi:hypothetical protein
MSAAVANIVAGLISLAVEYAHASNMAEEEVEQMFQDSYAKVKAKDPATHAHPDFGASGEGG